MIALLYPYLILIGGTILIVIAWLLHQAQRQAQRASELIRLNETLEFDLPDFLRASWPALSAGGFTGVSWQLVWFGTEICDTQGSRSSVFLSKDFDVGDIRLHVELYTPKSGWERSYFSRIMAEKFFLLLQMDLWIKFGSVRSTFEQTARMSVFLQHDIKNMLQLTNLAVNQLMTSIPGQEAKLLQILKRSLPALQERSNQILKRLVQSSEYQPFTFGKASAVDLPAFMISTLELHGLSAQVQGPFCRVLIAPDSFQSILDNLLGNYVQQVRSGVSSKMPQLRISWHIHNESDNRTLSARAEIDGGVFYVSIHLYDINGMPCYKPERLFEPFWSEHGKGRGIGLFQSRQLATQWGGTINAEAPSDGPLVFKIELPAKC